MGTLDILASLFSDLKAKLPDSIRYQHAQKQHWRYPSNGLMP